jgi:hypothetical protein
MLQTYYFAAFLPFATLGPTYRDEDGEYTGQPGGPLAFVDYHHGDDDDVIISIDIEDASKAPGVLLFGNGEVPLDQFERAARMVRDLLARPEVRAERIRAEAGATPKPAPAADWVEATLVAMSPEARRSLALRLMD